MFYCAIFIYETMKHAEYKHARVRLMGGENVHTCRRRSIMQTEAAPFTRCADVQDERQW